MAAAGGFLSMATMSEFNLRNSVLKNVETMLPTLLDSILKDKNGGIRINPLGPLSTKRIDVAMNALTAIQEINYVQLNETTNELCLVVKEGGENKLVPDPFLATSITIQILNAFVTKKTCPAIKKRMSSEITKLDEKEKSRLVRAVLDFIQGGNRGEHYSTMSNLTVMCSIEPESITSAIEVKDLTSLQAFETNLGARFEAAAKLLRNNVNQHSEIVLDELKKTLEETYQEKMRNKDHILTRNSEADDQQVDLDEVKRESQLLIERFNRELDERKQQNTVLITNIQSLKESIQILREEHKQMGDYEELDTSNKRVFTAKKNAMGDHALSIMELEDDRLRVKTEMHAMMNERDAESKRLILLNNNNHFPPSKKIQKLEIEASKGKDLLFVFSPNPYEMQNRANTAMVMGQGAAMTWFKIKNGIVSDELTERTKMDLTLRWLGKGWERLFRQQDTKHTPRASSTVLNFVRAVVTLGGFSNNSAQGITYALTMNRVFPASIVNSNSANGSQSVINDLRNELKQLQNKFKLLGDKVNKISNNHKGQPMPLLTRSQDTNQNKSPAVDNQLKKKRKYTPFAYHASVVLPPELTWLQELPDCKRVSPFLLNYVEEDGKKTLCVSFLRCVADSGDNCIFFRFSAAQEQEKIFREELRTGGVSIHDYVSFYKYYTTFILEHCEDIKKSNGKGYVPHTFTQDEMSKAKATYDKMMANPKRAAMMPMFGNQNTFPPLGQTSWNDEEYSDSYPSLPASFSQ